MSRILLVFLILAVMNLFACDRESRTADQKSTAASAPKTATDQRNEPLPVELQPEPAPSGAGARKQLEELKIAYNAEDFMDRITQGDAVAVELFLAAGMNPNVRVNHQIPLVRAASTGHSTIVRMLIEKGADPREGSETTCGCGHDALYWAAYEEDIDTLRVLLNAGVDVDNARPDRSPLTEPAKWGNIKVVRLLLEKGVKPSDEAMVEATRNNWLRIVRLLLEYNADPNARDNYGTALSNAIMRNNLDMVEVLLYAGADVNARDNSGETPLMRAEYGWTEYLDLLLRHGADPNVRDNDGETPLIRATKTRHAESRPRVARSRCVEVITALLDAGADPDIRDREGKTAAMYADEKGFQNIVDLLERPRVTREEPRHPPAPSRKTLPETEDRKGGGEELRPAEQTYDFAAALEPRKKIARLGIPFDMATFVNYAERRDFDHVKLFLNAGIDPDAGEHNVGTALMHAAENGETEMAQLLLERGADPDARFSGWDETALYRASRQGHTEIVRLLLDKGADVDVKQIHGTTPLMAALAQGHTDIAALILQHNPDVKLREDGRWGSGNTALLSAVTGGHTDIIDQLIERGADVNAEGGFGTALSLAAAKGRLDLVKTLIDHGARVSGTSGAAPLLEAAKEGHSEIVRFLLDSGADANARDEDGRTVFLLAVKNGYLDSLGLFLEKGADVNAKDLDGETALMRAALDGNVEAVNILLENGASVNTLDNAGASALSRAELRGHIQIAESLRHAGAVHPQSEGPAEVQAKLLSQTARLDIDVDPFSANWDDDPETDGAVISILLWGTGGKAVDFEGIELSVQIDIYAATGERANSNECWERLVYRKNHTVTSRQDKIKIPYEDIEPLRPGEQYSAVDAAVTLPDGRTIEEKTCWGSMIRPVIIHHYPQASPDTSSSVP